LNGSINDWGCAFTPNFRPKKCLKEVEKNDWEKNLRAGSSPDPVKGSYVRSKQNDKIMMRGK